MALRSYEIVPASLHEEATTSTAPDQRVWIYCQFNTEANRVATFCRDTRHIRRSPAILSPSGRQASLVPALKLNLHNLPTPYATHGWGEFASDVDVLLSASAADAASRRAAGKSTRHPTLLVTDLRRLCQLSADCELHTTLIELVGDSLTAKDLLPLLPVVLAQDFTRISGEAVMQPPLRVMVSTVLDPLFEEGSSPSMSRAQRGSTRGSYNEARTSARISARTSENLQDPASRQAPRNSKESARASIEANSQQPTRASIEMGANNSAEASEDGRRPRLDSSACDDTSSKGPDSPRLNSSSACDDASIKGPASRERPTSRGGLISSQSYRQPTNVAVIPGVYVQRWEPPVASAGFLTESAPEPVAFGARCLAILSSGHCVYSAVSFDGARGVEASGHWEVLNGQIVIRGKDPKTNHVELVGPEPQQLTDESEYDEPIQISLSELRDSFAPPLPLGACVSKVSDSLQQEFVRIRKKLGIFCQPPQETNNEAEAAAMITFEPTRSEAQVSALMEFPTCPLKPGFYRYEAGIPDTQEYRLLELTLRGDQSYVYSEQIFHTLLRSTHRKPLWYVDGDRLILSCSGTVNSQWPCFEHFVPRGQFRKLQTQVQRVELLVTRLKQMCSYTPIRQKLHPFLGHETQEGAEKTFVCGIVDPRSLALTDPVFDQATVSVPGFEAELYRAGFNPDMGVSDLSFLDRDHDGSISSAELHQLSDYPDVVVTPELMIGLAEALIEVYQGNLTMAFQEMLKEEKAKSKSDSTSKQQDAPEKAVTLETFKSFLEKCGKKKENKQLADWIKNMETQDQDAVFACMNLENRGRIDQVEFMSMLLHKGMAAVRKMEHFRRWLVVEFGKSEQAFSRAFRTMDVAHAGHLSEAEFIQGVQHIRYPGQAGAASIFALLDLSFNGCVTEEHFKVIQTFSSKRFSSVVIGLKTFVQKFGGGFDVCFRNIVQREEKLTGEAIASISFSGLQRAFHQGGFDMGPSTWNDVKVIFNFLDISSGTQSPGHLTAQSFGLIQSFDSRAVEGSPVRLRNFLTTTYGGFDSAFEKIRGRCQLYVVSERLERLAFNGLVRAFLASGFVGALGATPRKTVKKSIFKPASGDAPQPLQSAIADKNQAAHGESLASERPKTISLAASAGTPRIGNSVHARATMLVSRLVPINPSKLHGEQWALPPRRFGDVASIEAGTLKARSGDDDGVVLGASWVPSSARLYSGGVSKPESWVTKSIPSVAPLSARSDWRQAKRPLPKLLPNIDSASTEDRPTSFPPLPFPKGAIVPALPCTPRVPTIRPGTGATSAIDWDWL